MKRSLRPLFTILLLIFFAGILTFRLPLHRLGYLNLGYDIPPTRAPKKPVFNETLLRLAATDLAEPNLKQEIESLLEGNPGNRGRRRSFLSSGKYHVHVRSRSPELPEFRRLWQSFRRHLSDWSRNRRFFYSDVMPELVSSVKVSLDEFNGGKGVTEKFKTCAVVGNSGILLKTDYGGIIDGHESVIRLNNARIRGYERKVGAKTNISFVNSNILHSCARRSGCFCHPYGVNIALIMYICQPAHFFDYLVCNSSHKAPLIVTDPRFDMLCSRIVKYYSLKRFVEVKGKDPAEWAAFHDGSNFHYSSGMQAVMLAVVMCEKVSIFGFGKSERARHHYHTNQRGELSLHDYEAEYDLYRDLEGGVMIPFVSGSFKFPPFVMYH